MECCRICLATQELLHIFEKEEIASNITAIASVQINQCDGLPQYICVLCRHELDISISFKDKCETTFKMLREQYDKEIEVRENIILNLLSGGNALEDKLPEQARRSILNTVKNSVENNVHGLNVATSDNATNNTPVDTKYLLEMESDFIQEENNMQHKLSGHPTQTDISQSGIEAFENQMTPEIDPDNLTTTMTDDYDHMTDITESEFEIREHLSIKNQDLTCLKCNFCFVNESCLVDHLKRIHSKTMGQCQICLLYFPTSQFLKDHLKLKHDVSDGNDDVENRCKVCNKIFMLQSELNTHLCSFPGQKEFWCELCQLNFNFETDLENHVKYAHQQLEFVCEQCNENFECFDMYKKHLKEHSDVNRSIGYIELLCTECNMCFLSNEEFTKHMDMCRTKENFNRKEKSKGFHKSFTKSPHLTDHQRANKNIRSHVCSICHSSFQKKDNLEAHLLEHNYFIKCRREDIYINCD